MSIQPVGAAGHEHASAARFLRGLAARSAFLLAATAALNLLVDPLGVHGSRILEPIAWRTLGEKLFLHERMQPAPEAVVLGSSRSFNVDPAYITAKTSLRAFNASGGGAGIADYLDFARCFAARGRFPSLLIVAVGVEQAVADWRTFERNDRLDDCLRPQRTLGDRVRTYRGLVTLDETWASLRVLGMEMTGRPAPEYTFADDGMIRGFGDQPPGLLDQRLTVSLAGAWGPRNFPRDTLSPESMARLRELLDLSRAHGGKVIVYLPPYHPRAVALYLKESHFASARSRLLEQLGAWTAEYPLRVHDFTEVSRFGGRDDMFTDASHPTADGDRLMLDVMLPGGR